MKNKCPSWRGEATVRLRRQGRRGMAFTGAERKPLTEKRTDQAQGLARKGSERKLRIEECDN
jgi:hypothetical protein